MRCIRFIIIFICIFLGACGSRYSEELDRIDALCDTDPQLAISMLDSIAMGDLSNADRHRYDLLSIKSRDKAYIRHTSDSLILDVIDYYSGHRKEGLNTEALYYGGRVYSDLGDLPTALEYFQKALDELPDDKEHLKLKGNVLSQTGRLLDELKLFNQATEYISKAIDCYLLLNDTTEIFYSNILHAEIDLSRSDIPSAKAHLLVADKFSDKMEESDKAWIRTEYARILLMENKVDSALAIVRPLLHISDSLVRNYILTVASDVYRQAGINDTSYIYAKKVASDSDPRNAKVGYQLLLTSQLNKMIPQDSVIDIVKAYRSSIDSILRMNKDEDALIQNTKYNYNTHRQKTTEISKSYDRVKVIVFMLIFVPIIVYILMYKNSRSLSIRNKNLSESVKNLSQELTDIKSNEVYKKYEEIKETDTVSIEKKEILSLFSNKEKNEAKTEISMSVLESDVFYKLSDILKNDKSIPQESELWNEIYCTIDKSFPEFKNQTDILTNGRMTRTDTETVYLMKFGFAPTQIGALCSISKSSVSSRRTKLCKMIFRDSKNLSGLDSLIEWL